MVLVKNWQFSHFAILSKIGQKNVFHNILEGKKRLSRLSKKGVQKVEKLIFLKGVSPWFLSKIGNFSIFLDKSGQENVLYDIPERKNAFLEYKDKKFQKIEKLGFFQKG